MKKKNLFYLLIILIALIAAGSIIFGLSYRKTKNSITIGFYDTTENLADSLSTLVKRYSESSKIKAKFYVFDSTGNISEQVKNVVIAVETVCLEFVLNVVEMAINNIKQKYIKQGKSDFLFEKVTFALIKILKWRCIIRSCE